MPTRLLTLIDAEEARTVEAVVADDGVRVPAVVLTELTGWEPKPEGLCRGDVCIPAALTPDLVTEDGIDLATFARVTERLAVVDGDAGVAVLGMPAAVRADALATLDAPPFVASDLDGARVELADFRGRKKLLVAFASW